MNVISEIGYLLWGLAFGYALSVPVGPVNIICLRRSLFGHARDGFVIGLGAAAGDAIYAGLAALGLKAFVSLISSYDIAFRIVGAAVMLIFAIRIWRSHPHLDGEPLEGGVVRGLFASFFLTISNPGIFVGFLGFFALAGIGDLGAGDDQIHSDAIALIAGVFLGASAWWLTLAALGSFLRGRINDRFLVIVNHVSAILIGLFAIGALGSVLVS